MSNDYEWRQLGSIVNAVLMDAKTKAIRTGAIRKIPANGTPGQAHRAGSLSQGKALGNGFLRAERPAAATAAQLELPFGIGSTPMDEPHARRAARLI